MAQGAPTMRDVAALAGVSQATVSLVLNDQGRGRVSASTHDRIIAAVRDLGYRTNAAAKTLRDGVAPLLGFIGDEVASAPFAGKVVEGAQARAWEDGLLLLVVNTGGDERIESLAAEQMLTHQVRRFVYASMYDRRLRVPEELAGSDVVVLNGLADDDAVPSVAPDEVAGGRDATRHLVEAGHRRIGFINIHTRDSGLPAAVGRQQGYRAVMAEAGLGVDESLVKFGYGEPEHGYLLTRELMELDEPPTAIFCGNDRTAWGAYQALAELGLRIPEDVSIVGFDNQHTLAPFLRPALTTMNLPFHEMGWSAVDVLLGESKRPAVTLLACDLVERDSVAAPPSRPRRRGNR